MKTGMAAPQDNTQDSTSNTITVTIRNGMVERVAGLPAGTTLLIRDYDTHGMEGDGIMADPQGKAYLETLWTADPLPED